MNQDKPYDEIVITPKKKRKKLPKPEDGSVRKASEYKEVIQKLKTELDDKPKVVSSPKQVLKKSLVFL